MSTEASKDPITSFFEEYRVSDDDENNFETLSNSERSAQANAFLQFMKDDLASLEKELATTIPASAPDEHHDPSHPAIDTHIAFLAGEISRLEQAIESQKNSSIDPGISPSPTQVSKSALTWLSSMLPKWSNRARTREADDLV